MTYVLIYAGLLLCGFVSIGNSSRRNALYYVCLFGLFFFVGFRYRVGCDWLGYLSIFEAAGNSLTAEAKSEPAFWAVNRLLHYFELEYPYINVITSACFFVGLHALAKRQPDRLGVLILAFPILILNLAMSADRQAIGLGFLCFAYNAFVDTRLVRYVLFVTIAATFHYSAILFLVLAPLVRGNFSRQRIALGGLLALPGLYYLLASETFGVYTSRYVGTGPEAAGAVFRTGFLALSGAAFLWLLDQKWKARSIRDYKFVKIFSYAMVASFAVSLYSSVIGDRIAYYLLPAQLMIFARLPLLFRGGGSTIVVFAPYAAEAVLLLAWITLSPLFQKCYEPYQIWW
jgi:hypothetical protein